MAAHSGTLSKLLSIGRRADSHFDRRIALLALLSLIAAGIEIAVLGSIVPVLALVAKRSPSNVSLSTIFGGDPLSIVLLFAGLVLGAAVARLALAAAIQRGVLKIGHAINTAIQRRLLYQPYLFHVSSNSSRFVAALQKADQLAFGVLGPLIQGAAGVIIGLAILAFLLMTVDWRVTAGACVVLGGSYFVMSRYAASRLVERGGAAVTAYEDQIKLMMESSGAIRDVLLDHRQQAFADAFERASMRMAKAREGTDLLNYAPRFMVEAVGAIAIAGLAVFIALREGGIAGSLPMLASWRSLWSGSCRWLKAPIVDGRCSQLRSGPSMTWRISCSSPSHLRMDRPLPRFSSKSAWQSRISHLPIPGRPGPFSNMPTSP